jgi:Transposase, Mutator family
LERIMKEIRRRSRVMGTFPDGQSCLNLAVAALRRVAGTTWATKRYMHLAPGHQSNIKTDAAAGKCANDSGHLPGIAAKSDGRRVASNL